MIHLRTIKHILKCILNTRLMIPTKDLFVFHQMVVGLHLLATFLAGSVIEKF